MRNININTDCQNCEFRSLIFSGLKDNEIHLLNINKSEKIYAKGEIIIEEGNKVNEFFYLKKGLVKLHKTGENNKDHIISIAQPNDFISLLSVFYKSEYEFSITAIEESFICSIKLGFLKKLIINNGEFSVTILKKMSETYNNIINTRFLISNKHLRGRIAYILLYFSDTIYNSNRFELPLSRREIGELINMTTENVIRILSEFRKDKIIIIDGKIIEITNMDFLRKICKAG